MRRRLKAKSLPRNGVLPIGAVVSRENRGVRHDVEIAAEGVIYGGRATGQQQYSPSSARRLQTRAGDHLCQ
jgi:hypothetical protein